MKESRARTREIEREGKARLGWLLIPVMAVNKRPREFFSAPTTTAARLAENMGEAYQQRSSEVGEVGIAEDMLCCWLTDNEMKAAFARVGASIEKRRERLSRRYLGNEILALLDAAHASV